MLLLYQCEEVGANYSVCEITVWEQMGMLYICLNNYTVYVFPNRQATKYFLFSSLINVQVIYYKAALKFFHSIITGGWLALHYCLSPCLEFTTRCLLFLLKMSVSGRD